MLSKSLIQFSVDGGSCAPSLLFDLRPNYGGGSEDDGDLLQNALAHTATLSAPDPAAGHCQCMPLPETPDTHGQVWASLFWGHCSLLLGPGAHKVLFFPSKSLFPQSCVSSGCPMVELMATSSNRAYAIPRPVAPQSPWPCGRPLLTRTSAGDTQTLFWLSPCGVSGSWCTQGLFEPFKGL